MHFTYWNTQHLYDMEAPLLRQLFVCILVLNRMPLSECKEVVIVGGGVSGLAAASHLCRNGICNITILEAEDRLGGRLQSDRFHGSLIQRGAQFIHGETDNPIYDVLSQEYKLMKLIYDDPMELSFLRVSGQPVDNESVTKYGIAIDKVSTRLMDNLDEARDVCKNVEDELTRLWTMEEESTLSGIDRNVTDAMLNHLLTFLSIENGDLTRKVGVLSAFYHEYLGDDYLVDGDYADALIGILKKSIPDSAVKLQQRVMRIDWNISTSEKNHCAFKSNDSVVMVRVLYKDVNSGEMSEVCADHVIVTVSVGVLQKHHTTMFNPKFTDEKSRALQSLPIGIVNKVFLYFKQRFWKTKVIDILWDSNFSDEFGEDSFWYRHIYSIEDYGNDILLFWLNSYASQAISHFTKDEVAQNLTVLLRKVLLNDSIPLPDDVLVTAWHEDDNFLGSYSYIPVGATLENKTIAAAPLSVAGVPKVLFAGEAMHHSRFSTVDGAYRTGIEEADKILSDSGRSSRSNPIISIFLHICVYMFSQ